MVPSIVTKLRNTICEKCESKCDKFKNKTLDSTSENEICSEKLWPTYNKPSIEIPRNTEEPKQLPSKIQMAKNLGSSIFDALQHKMRGGNILVSKEISDERLKICGVVSGSITTPHCEFLLDEKKCSECGCFVEAKVQGEAMFCPKGKW